MTKLKTLNGKLHQIRLKQIKTLVRAHQFRAKLGLNLHSVYSTQLNCRSRVPESLVTQVLHTCWDRLAASFQSAILRQGNYLLKPTTNQSLLHSSRASEILFKPELIGRDHYGMHESLFKSILSSDIDLRRSFLGNIVLSGNSCFLLVCKCYTTVSGLHDAVNQTQLAMLYALIWSCFNEVFIFYFYFF